MLQFLGLLILRRECGPREPLSARGASSSVRELDAASHADLATVLTSTGADVWTRAWLYQAAQQLITGANLVRISRTGGVEVHSCKAMTACSSTHSRAWQVIPGHKVVPAWHSLSQAHGLHSGPWLKMKLRGLMLAGAKTVHACRSRSDCLRCHHAS